MEDVHFFEEPLFSYRMHEKSLTYSFKEGWAIEFQKEYVFLRVHY